MHMEISRKLWMGYSEWQKMFLQTVAQLLFTYQIIQQWGEPIWHQRWGADLPARKEHNISTSKRNFVNVSYLAINSYNHRWTHPQLVATVDTHNTINLHIHIFTTKSLSYTYLCWLSSRHSIWTQQNCTIKNIPVAKIIYIDPQTHTCPIQFTAHTHTHTKITISRDTSTQIPPSLG